jgi:prepilin-type N-terminal cleavage/methylation domain-containing protein
VSPCETIGVRAWRSRQRGFSLLEMLLAIAILLVVTGIVMSAMMQMTMTQGTVANRTEMHSSVRSATELLQQEIGQAGKVALPGLPTLSTAVAAGNLGTAMTVTVSDATGMFNGEQLVIDTGDNEETVTISVVSLLANTFSAIFTGGTHAIGVPVRVSGAFASGIIPTTAICGVVACGSTGFLLKLYGDINDDGNMQYMEYNCDTTGGNLYRNVVNIATGATKPAVNASMIVLSNVLPNPPDPGTTTAATCFKYQE